MGITRKISYIWDLVKILIAKIIADLMRINKKNKDMWLIGERKSEAKDNGYHLFKYIRNNYPEKNIYYVIDKKSEHLSKIKPFNNIIYHGTMKHYIYFLLANKLVCSHQGSCVPDTPVFWKLLAEGVIKKKKYYIKHGIVKEAIPSLMFKNTSFKMIACGAKPEYEFIKKEFGYDENSVRYLGLCRFDNLHDYQVKKQQIVIMPTWRQWFELGASILDKDKQKNREEFLNSEYYKRYYQLINNQKLDKILQKENSKLIFYPHHEMQRFLDDFKTDCKNIMIADEKIYDVQDILKESEILVTDFSSVAFDFAYMKKPIIYYQFDSKRYFAKHYPKGYFDYNLNGFGPVVNNEISLIAAIEKLLKEGSMEQQYLERENYFFEIHDRNNCKRTYEAICEIN